MSTYPARRRLTGQALLDAAAELGKAYTAGASIRAIASDTGRSYGWVHRTLLIGGVDLRPRGGAQPRKTGDA